VGSPSGQMAPCENPRSRKGAFHSFLQRGRPVLVADATAGDRGVRLPGAAGTTLTFDCNSHCMNQKHA
jgi:hypothetical protein